MKRFTVFLSLILIMCLFAPPVSAAEDKMAVDAGCSHVLALNQNGRVFSAGDNTYGQCMTYGWKNVVSICAGKYFSAALLSDGKVVAVGQSEDGAEIDTSALSNIVQIDAGDNFLAALDADGNVYVVGNSSGISVDLWSDVVKIACGKKHIVALDSSGNCFGSGNSSAASVDEFDNIEDIFAGANLTVLKDTSGMLYHAGLGVYTKSDGGEEEVGNQWLCSSWTDIKDLKIIPGVNDRGIVVAITSDGSIKTDGIYTDTDVDWSESFAERVQGLVDVEDIALLRFASNYYAITVKNDSTLEYISDETAVNNFTEEMDTFDLTMVPLDFEEDLPQIAAGAQTIGILLPDGSVATIGKTDIEGFEGIKNLSVTKSYSSQYAISDYFFGVTDSGQVITNLENEEKAEAGIDTWKGVEKVESYYWLIDGETADETDNRLIGALRWDKRLYSSHENSKNVKNFSNIVDIAGGMYFTAALAETGKVYIESYSTMDTTGVSDWENISKIYAGKNHIVGLKKDGSCVSAGKSGDVTGWSNIVDIACGNNFTVGLDKDGKCYYASNSSTSSYQKQKAVVDSWENVSRIFGSESYVLAYKNDGTFEYAQLGNQTNFKIPQISNTFFKDNVFYTYYTDGNAALVDYYSDKDLVAYVSFFDEEDRPVDFKKITLNSSLQLTQVQITSEKSNATKCTVEVENASADKLMFYMEHVVENDGLVINYCSDADRKVAVAIYGENNRLKSFTIETLTASSKLKKISYESDTDAVRYNVLIWDEMTPIYRGEGLLR